jgi:hypothetical protein
MLRICYLGLRLQHLAKQYLRTIDRWRGAMSPLMHNPSGTKATMEKSGGDHALGCIEVMGLCVTFDGRVRLFNRR